MHSASIHSLPQELLDAIVDCLYVPDDPLRCLDTASLAACTLACRALHVRSTKHLFHTLRLSTGSLDDLRRTLPDAPRLRDNVVELCVAQPLAGPGRTEIVLKGFVEDVVGRLSKLKRLEVCGDRIVLEESGPPPGDAKKHELHTLRLEAVEVTCLPRLLQLFSRIDTLHLKHVSSRACTPPMSAAIAVRSLVFSGPTDTLRILGDTLDADRLGHALLSFEDRMRADHSATNDFLRRVGRALSSLEIRLPMDYGWVPARAGSTDLDGLAHCVNLRRLTLRTPPRTVRAKTFPLAAGPPPLYYSLLAYPSQHTHSGALFARSLAPLADLPPQVREVEVVVNAYVPRRSVGYAGDVARVHGGECVVEALREVGWGKLESVLGRVAGLERVIVRVAVEGMSSAKGENGEIVLATRKSIEAEVSEGFRRTLSVTA